MLIFYINFQAAQLSQLFQTPGFVTTIDILSNTMKVCLPLASLSTIHKSFSKLSLLGQIQPHKGYVELLPFYDKSNLRPPSCSTSTQQMALPSFLSIFVLRQFNEQSSPKLLSSFLSIDGEKWMPGYFRRIF